MRTFVVKVAGLMYCTHALCSIDAVVEAMTLYPDATRISVSLKRHTSVQVPAV